MTGTIPSRAPLDPLRPEEIRAAGMIARAALGLCSRAQVVAMTLEEPEDATTASADERTVGVVLVDRDRGVSHDCAVTLRDASPAGAATLIEPTDTLLAELERTVAGAAVGERELVAGASAGTPAAPVLAPAADAAAPELVVVGHTVAWRGWSLHVGFCAREGLVLRHLAFTHRGVRREVAARAAFASPEDVPRGRSDTRALLGAGVAACTAEADAEAAAAIDVHLADPTGEPIRCPRAVRVYEVEDDRPLIAEPRAARLEIVACSRHDGDEHVFTWSLHEDGTARCAVVSPAARPFTMCLRAPAGSPDTRVPVPAGGLTLVPDDRSPDDHV